MMLQLLYFMLPAYFANMSPVFGRFFLKNFNTPVSQRYLGSHKTWKGFILGILAAIIVSFVQFKLDLTTLNLIDYNNWLLFGFLMGFGALFGDAVKSFFKRRLKIRPGVPWVPFDEIDYSIGSLVFASFIYFPGWLDSFVIIIMNFFLHIIVNHLAFFLHIRGEKW